MSVDPSELDLLHAIRLRGLVGATELSRLTDESVTTVEETLVSASSKGLVIRTRGRISGWSLTDEGRLSVEHLLTEEVDRLGVRDALVDVYESFLMINAEVLAICTAWQVVDVAGTAVPNDHRDALYDAQVLDSLRGLHGQVVPIVARLGELTPRLGGYDGRLTVAHEKISMGDTRWLTSPAVDSYHSIWFELHENLLVNLGRRRSRG